MKKVFIICLAVLFMVGCGGRKKKLKAPPDLSPPRFDLRSYECQVGDWCPDKTAVLNVITAISTCHHNKYIEWTSGKARNPCIPPVDWRKVVIHNSCSSSGDSAGNTIDIYWGRDCSYSKNRTAEQNKRTILSLVAHAEGHNSVCTSAGNAAHCAGDRDGDGQWDCQLRQCKDWCDCCKAVGLGC